MFDCLDPACFLFSPEHISVSGESFLIVLPVFQTRFLKSSRVEKGEFLQRMPGQLQNKNIQGGYCVRMISNAQNLYISTMSVTYSLIYLKNAVASVVTLYCENSLRN